MVRTKGVRAESHGFHTCKHCRTIVFVLATKEAFEPAEGVRSNELGRLCALFSESKFATPTLVRHLTHLQKEGIVKKVEKGKQNVQYFLSTTSSLFSRKDLDFQLVLANKYLEGFGSLNVKKLVNNHLALAKLYDLEFLKIDLERTLKKEKSGILMFKAFFIRSFLDYYGKMLQTAIKDRGGTKEALDLVNIAVADARKEVTETLNLALKE